MSDFNKVSLSSCSPQASETQVEFTTEHEAMEEEDMNDDDEDEESDSDSSINRSDISNILISLNGRRLRYKVISLLSPVSFGIIKLSISCKTFFFIKKKYVFEGYTTDQGSGSSETTGIDVG